MDAARFLKDSTMDATRIVKISAMSAVIPMRIEVTGRKIRARRGGVCHIIHGDWFDGRSKSHGE